MPTEENKEIEGFLQYPCTLLSKVGNKVHHCQKYLKRFGAFYCFFLSLG